MVLFSFVASSWADSDSSVDPSGFDLREVPSLENRELVGPLSELIDHLSPKDDGWETEAFSEVASEKLYQLTAALKASKPNSMDFEAFAVEAFKSERLYPEEAQLESLTEGEFHVRRWNGKGKNFQSQFLFEACQQFRSVFAVGEPLQLAPKLTRNGGVIGRTKQDNRG